MNQSQYWFALSFLFSLSVSLPNKEFCQLLGQALELWDNSKNAVKPDFDYLIVIFYIGMKRDGGFDGCLSTIRSLSVKYSKAIVLYQDICADNDLFNTYYWYIFAAICFCQSSFCRFSSAEDYDAEEVSSGVSLPAVYWSYLVCSIFCFLQAITVFGSIILYLPAISQPDWVVLWVGEIFVFECDAEYWHLHSFWG